MSQEWLCSEPIRRPERQQERCREKQRVKVICSAASFGYLIKCICPTKTTESSSRLAARRQTATRYVLKEDSRGLRKGNHSRWNIVEMQNPAHSLHTVGLQTPDVGPPQFGCPTLLAQFTRGREILSGKRLWNPTLTKTEGWGTLQDFRPQPSDLKSEVRS